MLKKFLFIFIPLAILTMPNVSYSSVVGIWSVKGIITENVRVTGAGESTVQLRGRDVFTFYKDRRFISLDGIRGKWSQKRSNFSVLLNKSDIRSLFYSMANDYGLNVLSFNVPSAYISGKASSSRITGTMVMEMQGDAYAFNGNVLTLYAKATISFSGKKTTNTARLFSVPQTESKLTNLIRIMVRSFIEEAEVSR